MARLTKSQSVYLALSNRPPEQVGSNLIRSRRGRSRPDKWIQRTGLPFANVPDNSRPNAPEVREEILGEFSMLFAADGQGENPDELDLYECRFNRAFRMFRIDFLRSETARTKPLEALPEEGRIEEPEVNEKRVAHLPEALRRRGMQLPNVQLASFWTPSIPCPLMNAKPSCFAVF